MRKKIIMGLILYAMSIFLCACGKAETLSVKIPATSTDVVVQGADDFGKLSVGETGVLHIKDQHILFFDYEAKKDYVICSRANCRHNDGSCNGWYSGYHGAWGLAEYGGKLYCFIGNSEKNVYQLVQMDLDGNHRKSIAEIDLGDNSPGQWSLNTFPFETYYAGDKVITKLEWLYNPADKSETSLQTQQCIAVDLRSGEIIEVTQRQEESVECSILAVSKDYVLIETSGYQDQMLSKKEFYEQYEQGAFSDYDNIMKAENPYETYCEVYFDEMEHWYRFFLFDLGEGDIRMLEEGILEKVRNEDGEVYALRPPFYITGLYENDLIAEKIEEGPVEGEAFTGTVENRVYCWNLNDNQKRLILDLNNGYVFDAGGIDASCIVDGDKLFFLRRKADGKADYYSYSLKTGEEKLLYEAERNVPYRIVGETETRFIYYTADDTKKTMYMMDKADYYNGNFENSVRLKALDEYF